MSAKSSKELLNDDVYLKILSYLPVFDLLNNIPLVNKKFNDFTKENSLWKLKCENEGISTKAVQPNHHLPYLYMELYFNNTFSYNLILNPCANEEFKHWKKEKNGGDGMKVEGRPAGADNFPQDLLEEAGKQSVKNWVTSYADGEKSQTIDIAARGIDVRLLDKYKPDIIASEWYCGRFDCGNEYRVNVQLLDKKRRIVKEIAFDDRIPTGDKEWRKFVDIITDYGTGVRYIKFTHKSCDIRFWAGHYGGKFTMSSVRLRFNFTSH